MDLPWWRRRFRLRFLICSHILTGCAITYDALFRVYATSACNNFARSRPFLSKVVWARPGIPADVVFADVRRWHQTNPNYPPARAIGLATEQIRTGLVAQVPGL